MFAPLGLKIGLLLVVQGVVAMALAPQENLLEEGATAPAVEALAYFAEPLDHLAAVAVAEPLPPAIEAGSYSLRSAHLLQEALVYLVSQDYPCVKSIIF